MKNNLPIILGILIASTLLLNCNCKHLCSSPSLFVSLANFDSTTLNAVIVKQYNNNGQFNDLQHTKVYTSKLFTGANTPGQDTMQLDSNKILMEFFNDYTIEVPAAGKTWYLKNMSMQPAKMSEPQCTNGLSYILNDTSHTIPAYPKSSYFPVVIYLNR